MKAGWKTKRLGDLCEIIKGRKPALKQTQSSGDLPYLIAKVIRGSKEAEYASVKDRNSIIVTSSETIIICDGSNSGEVFTGYSGILSSTMGKISKKEEIDGNYLRAFLESTFEIFNGAKTGAAIPHLDKEAMYNLQLSYPPLPEQKRIVGILDEDFSGIATAKAHAEKNLKNARAVFDSHLEAVFSRRGEGWVETNLGDVCHQITDGKHGDCEDEANSGFYFLSAKDVKGGTLAFENARQITKKDFEETHKRTNLKPGNILITNSGTIGRMAIAPVDERTPNSTFQKSVAILKPIESLIDHRFTFYCLSSGLSRFVGLSAGTAQKNLLLRDLRSYHFSLPRSIEKQQKVVEQLDALAEETTRLKAIYKRKSAALEELKKALLFQAFAGEL